MAAQSNTQTFRHDPFIGRWLILSVKMLGAFLNWQADMKVNHHGRNLGRKTRNAAQLWGFVV
jgi:hypothetical protein